ncbi:MAG TPA: hypothetical protein VG650_07255 [Mycobacteriales bacterium]|nr:hypothetical protein [Mycobacteriales bacterium]HWC34610.1 hypothetical protein [Mycobacteriales bacterium]
MKWVGLAMLGVVAAGCSGSSTPGTSPTGPSAAATSPGASGSTAPTPHVTYHGVLAISHVLDVRPMTSGGPCPSAAQAFPHDAGTSRDVVACDPRQQQVFLLAPPALSQNDVDATTVSMETNGGGWAVDLQLSPAGARTFLALTKRAYEVTGSGETGFGSCRPPRGCNAIAIVYNGVAVAEPAIAQDGLVGGLVQIGGLSHREAERIAASLSAS